VTAFLYHTVYASHREDAGLRLMVTSDDPKTWVNFANGMNSASQTDKRMQDVQLFTNDWLDTNAPGTWLMRNKEGQGAGLSGERTRVAHSLLNVFRVTEDGPVRARADLDKFWCWTGEEGSRGQLGAEPVAPSCLMQNWHLYAVAMWALTARIDYWNIPLTAAKQQLTGTAFEGVWRFLNRYSGVRWSSQSPGAWIGFRDGLDTLDVERFPEAKFGALPKNWQTMSLSASQSPTSKELLLKRQKSICHSFAKHGCRLEIDESTEAGRIAFKFGNGTNDVNLDVWRSDYGMFLQRRNNSGSVGYWWQGPADQLYGRYSRGFAQPQSTIELLLDEGLWGGLPLVGQRRHLTLRLVFLDNSVGQFFLGYDALDGPRGWVVDTKGTSRWREVTFAIDDGRFAAWEGGGPHGADVWLRDMSECVSWTDDECTQSPTLFDSIEVVDTASEEAVVDPVPSVAEEHHVLPANPAPPLLAASAPCHWGHDRTDVPCAEWAHQGECKLIPDFMQAKCAASCGCPAPDFTRLSGPISTQPGSPEGAAVRLHVPWRERLWKRPSALVPEGDDASHTTRDPIIDATSGPGLEHLAPPWRQHAFVNSPFLNAPS
jgi:hypothetical protein